MNPANQNVPLPFLVEGLKLPTLNPELLNASGPIAINLLRPRPIQQSIILRRYLKLEPFLQPLIEQ